MAKKVNTKNKITKVMYWINLGIFPGYVLFCCGFSYKEIMKLLKKKGADDWYDGISQSKQLIEEGNYLGLRRDLENTKTGENKILHYIIIKEQFKFTDYEYCKLAHECLHICQFYLKDVLNRNSEIESEAYLHTHLMGQCLKVLRGEMK